MDFNITNHPLHTSVTRTASLTSMEVNVPEQKVKLNLKINHYLDGNHIPEMVKDIMSIADNILRLPNPMDGGETMIGEFDYWMLAYEGGTPLNQMLAGGIANIDANGLINAKCNYSI